MEPGLADPLQIVHLDRSCVVAVKPAGLPTVPGRPAALHDCLWHRVRSQIDDALVVHRLDMATSGLVVFARGLDMQRQLSRAFETRAVDKVYVAWVQGRLHIDRPPLCIELPIGADWPNRPRQQVDPLAGRAARTDVDTDRHDAVADRTRVRLVPHTGRTHQLRVHLAAIGHPIVGDTLYGTQPVSSGRLLLHAQTLGFAHPHTGRRLSWTSEAPF